MYVARSLGSARITAGQARASGMFSIRPKMRIQFFDRNVIKTNWKRINRDPLQKAGNLVRGNARESIKRRKYGGAPSPAGTPPRSRQTGKTPPFKMIYAVPFKLGTSVIVGMVGFNPGHPNPVPGLHEHGGMARRKVFQDFGQRRLKSGAYGKRITTYKWRTVKYPQRAFMQPALMRAINRMPEFWRERLPDFWRSSVGTGITGMRAA